MSARYFVSRAAASAAASARTAPPTSARTAAVAVAALSGVFVAAASASFSATATAAASPRASSSIEPQRRGDSSAPDGDDPIARMLVGVAKFSKEQCYPGSPYVETVENGQQPHSMVVSCSDSMVDPARLFDIQKPGEIFVARHIAGIIPPYVKGSEKTPNSLSAALEHGVSNLKVQNLIVKGHGKCGGVKALLQNASVSGEGRGRGFIQSWMQEFESVRQEVVEKHNGVSEEQIQLLCEQAVVKRSVENLMTYPCVREAVKKGELEIHGFHFDRGTLSVLKDGEFEVKIKRPTAAQFAASQCSDHIRGR